MMVDTGLAEICPMVHEKAADTMQQVPKVPTTAGIPEIVVGVDGSPESILALHWATTLAPALGATIVAVSAWQLEPVYGPYAAADWHPKAIAQEILTETLSKAFGESVPEELSAECFRGQPAKVLMERSKSAVMLILGSRGRGGFKGLLLGSVSTACTAHAQSPVLVVRTAPTSQAAANPVNSGNSVNSEGTGLADKE